MFIYLLIILLTIVYFLLALNNKYWEKRGVNGPKPTILIGNMGKSFILKASPGEIFSDIYKKYKNEDIVGVYKGTTPALLICNPQLIKEVTVKSFGHFHDNDIEIDKNKDPLFGRNPFALRGDEWKTVRMQLTPGFTSGKMKWLYPLLEDNCKKFVNFIDVEPKTTDGYNAEELCKRFTINNVASCAFGLDGKCFEPGKSELRQLAEEFFSPDAWNIFAFFLVSIFPPLSKIYKIKFVPTHVEKKLLGLVGDTIKYREENNIVRNDFLHIMTQLKSTCKDYEFTDLDITAHLAGFFSDGFLTTSLVMSFVLFEIAANPEVQDKLREEVIEAFDDQNNLPYEAIQGMSYLDGVVNETLRIHPPMTTLPKLCTKSFTFTTNGQSVSVDAGTSIILPIYGLHHDPEYFDDPDVFKPERFENKDNLTKHTFLPFGEGPRACLGQRFGLLQIKAGIAYIIRDFELLVNKKTKLPIKYDPTNFLTSPVGGFWLDFKKIAR